MAGSDARLPDGIVVVVAGGTATAAMVGAPGIPGGIGTLCTSGSAGTTGTAGMAGTPPAVVIVGETSADAAAVAVAAAAAEAEVPPPAAVTPEMPQTVHRDVSKSGNK